MARMNKEERRDLRIVMSKPLMIKCQIKKQREIFNLRPKKIIGAENISTGGICMELPTLNQRQIERIIEGKDKLVLEFKIPFFRSPLKVTGRIIWLKKRDRRGKTIYVTGISFEGIEEKDREKILLQLISLCLKDKGRYLI